MTKKDFQKWIVDNNACADGKSFAKNKTLAQVWKTCVRPDWMMWIYERSKSLDKNICVQIVRAAAYAADAAARAAAARATRVDVDVIKKQVCDYIRSVIVLPKL